MAEENVIELKSVEKTFRDFWMRPVAEAVRGLDLEVARGDVFGLIGPNGSGKSTTIKMILGLIRPTKGTVRLFGLDPRAKAARARLGYLPELSHLHPFLTAEETVLYYAGLSGMKRQEARRRMQELLKELKLAHVRRRTGPAPAAEDARPRPPPRASKTSCRAKGHARRSGTRPSRLALLKVQARLKILFERISTCRTSATAWR